MTMDAAIWRLMEQWRDGKHDELMRRPIRGGRQPTQMEAAVAGAYRACADELETELRACADALKEPNGYSGTTRRDSTGVGDHGVGGVDGPHEGPDNPPWWMR